MTFGPISRPPYAAGGITPEERATLGSAVQPGDAGLISTSEKTAIGTIASKAHAAATTTALAGKVGKGDLVLSVADYPSIAAAFTAAAALTKTTQVSIFSTATTLPVRATVFFPPGEYAPPSSFRQASTRYRRHSWSRKVA